MSIHRLIRDGRARLGLTEDEFAKKVGVSRSAVQQWEREGGTAPKRTNQPLVAELLGISVAELMGGSNIEDGPSLRGRVPVISWVQAGNWSGAADPLQPGDAERWLDCPVPHSNSTFALRVRGDSMTAPYPGRSYPEGCIIFVDPVKRSPVNGQRVIARLLHSDDVTFKVFKSEDGRVWLQPLNPMHRPIDEPFKVLGTVIGKWEDE